MVISIRLLTKYRRSLIGVTGIIINYPIEVLLSAVATNGGRFVSIPLIVHQFKPEMVVYCLQRVF